MTALHDFQRGFLDALLADEPSVDTGRFADGPVSVADGLAVYRNNVFAALCEALGALYPVVKTLVGDGFFAYAGNEFIRAHPPASPVMAEFGGAFPAFLDGFAPAASAPYLSDVARLELARHRALTAADRALLDVSVLRDVAPERLGDLRFVPHPSTVLFRAAYPALAIWDAHQGETEPTAVDPSPTETYLLVVRPVERVETLALSPDAFDLATRLADGETLASAFAATGGDWDPQPVLADLLAIGAFCDFILAEVQP